MANQTLRLEVFDSEMAHETLTLRQAYCISVQDWNTFEMDGSEELDRQIRDAIRQGFPVVVIMPDKKPVAKVVVVDGKLTTEALSTAPSAGSQRR